MNNFIMDLINITGITLGDKKFCFDVGPITLLPLRQKSIEKTLNLMFTEIADILMRHSQVTHVFVVIKEKEQYVEFSIRYDGKEFDITESHRMELKNLILWASEINSSLVIAIRPHRSSEFIIRVNTLNKFQKLSELLQQEQ